jgi:hypothetical protein
MLGSLHKNTIEYRRQYVGTRCSRRGAHDCPLVQRTTRHACPSGALQVNHTYGAGLINLLDDAPCDLTEHALQLLHVHRVISWGWRGRHCAAPAVLPCPQPRPPPPPRVRSPVSRTMRRCARCSRRRLWDATDSEECERCSTKRTCLIFRPPSAGWPDCRSTDHGGRTGVGTTFFSPHPVPAIVTWRRRPDLVALFVSRTRKKQEKKHLWSHAER